MAHDAKTRAEVLSAIATTHTLMAASRQWGVDPKTIRAWRKEAQPFLPPASVKAAQAKCEPTQPAAQQQPSQPAAPPLQPLSNQEVAQIRNAAIASMVAADIAKVREETRKKLASLAPLAIRRIEDATLPMRRKKVTDADGKERTELDPTYSPPKVDTSGALFLLVEVLGVTAENGALEEQFSAGDHTFVFTHAQPITPPRLTIGGGDAERSAAS